MASNPMDFEVGKYVEIKTQDMIHTGMVTKTWGIDPAFVEIATDHDAEKKIFKTTQMFELDKVEILNTFDSIMTCGGCDETVWCTEESEYYMERHGETLEQDQDYEWANYGEKEGSFVCSWCRESDMGDHASTLMRFGPDGKESVRFGDLIARETEYYEEPPQWFTDMIKGRNYVRTDGWRGYFDTKPTPADSYAKITDGWVTGYPDDTVSYKMTAADLHEQLHSETLVPPHDIYWLFEPTSNVFSTASEIWVDKENYDEMVEWFESVGFSVDKLERAFG